MLPQEIDQYITKSLSENKNKNEMYKELMDKGVDIDTVNERFKVVKGVGSEHGEEGAQKKAAFVVVVLGAVLVGAGVFSFIAANWTSMSSFAKVFVIILFMLLAHGAGIFVRERLKLLKTSLALFFLGTIIFGAGIFLVGQIFNISTTWPEGFILWMLGTLSMAYILDSKLFYVFGAVLGIIATVVDHSRYFLGLFSDFSRGVPFSLVTTLLLLIAAAVSFYVGNYLRKANLGE